MWDVEVNNTHPPTAASLVGIWRAGDGHMHIYLSAWFWLARGQQLGSCLQFGASQGLRCKLKNNSCEKAHLHCPFTIRLSSLHT
jgi:hypothetical protein